MFCCDVYISIPVAITVLRERDSPLLREYYCTLHSLLRTVHIYCVYVLCGVVFSQHVNYFNL